MSSECSEWVLRLQKVRRNYFQENFWQMRPRWAHFWPQFNACTKIWNWNHSFHEFKMPLVWIINSALWGAVRSQTVIAQREGLRIERNGRGVRRGSKLPIVVVSPKLSGSTLLAAATSLPEGRGDRTYRTDSRCPTWQGVGQGIWQSGHDAGHDAGQVV